MANNVPPRALRGHRPKRVSQRAANTGEYVARLAPHLTPRDRWLIHMLFEHQVFTTQQITELAFPSVRAANLRLRQLYVWRVVDRFQPFVGLGSAPMHYVLDAVGATVLAREGGLEARALGYRHERAMSLAYSLLLAHTVGTNGILAALVARSRQSDAGHLTVWWSESRCRRHFGDIVCPDAYGRWHAPEGDVEWFLEYDRATECPAKRVGDKLHRYAKLAKETGIVTPVLVWTPTVRRETGVRHSLGEALTTLPEPAAVPVATTSAELLPGGDPLDARWLPVLGSEPHRLGLTSLMSAWPRLPPLTPTKDESMARGTPAAPTLPPPTPQCPDLRSGKAWR